MSCYCTPNQINAGKLARCPGTAFVVNVLNDCKEHCQFVFGPEKLLTLLIELGDETSDKQKRFRRDSSRIQLEFIHVDCLRFGWIPVWSYGNASKFQGRIQFNIVRWGKSTYKLFVFKKLNAIVFKRKIPYLLEKSSYARNFFLLSGRLRVGVEFFSALNK